jgi:YegS/Rv2252/BmrU family lipid kinase
MNCKIIAHPKIREGNQRGVIKKIEDRLSKNNVQHSFEIGSKEETTRDIAKRISSKECDTVICIGGDGTLHGILNGLYGKNLKLGIIPFGFGNDMARFLNIPNDIDEALNIINNNKSKQYHLGEITSERTNIKEYFFSVVGMGFDVKVIEIVEKQNLKRRYGSFAYSVGAIKAIFSYKSPRIKMEYNNTVFLRKAMMVAVGNATTYGGGMKVTPKADPTNKSFNVTYLRQMGRLAFLWHFPKVFSGKHIEVEKYVLNFDTPEIYIDCWPRSKIIADGELLDMLPAKVSKSKYLQKIIIP